MVPVTVAAHFGRAPAGPMFFLAALAIVPLAKFIGEATEELSVRVGSALGGLLNATFGNATELIIGILALKAGLIEVVESIHHGFHNRKPAFGFGLCDIPGRLQIPKTKIQ